MTSDGWLDYAHYARQLDEVRAEEAARTAGMREGVAQMSAHADGLEGRLHRQTADLQTLAGRLHLRRPKLQPVAPEERVDPPQGLTKLAATMDEVDREASTADRRGMFPELLPNVRGRARGILFYGVAALVVLALQARAFGKGGIDTSPITVLFILPALGFAIAYTVMRVGSRVRRAPEGPLMYTRMGAAICFLIGPIGAIAVIAGGSASR